jgi:hypothetical protein
MKPERKKGRLYYYALVEAPLQSTPWLIYIQDKRKHYITQPRFRLGYNSKIFLPALKANQPFCICWSNK